MPRILRWTGYVLAGLVGIVVLASGFVFARSEWIVRRTYEARTEALEIPTDSASIAEGERLARIRGCQDGCHGPDAGGEVFFDEAGVARLVAPNLTRIVHSYSAAQLDAAIRGGVKPNGRSVWVMPSEMFRHLSDDDFVRIVAFLRTLPRVDGHESGFHMGPLGRVGVVLGEFRPTTHYMDLDHAPPAARDSSEERGRYLAITSCTECHGMDLGGEQPAAPGTPPALAIAGAYSPETFARLMSEGVPLDGRDLGLMKEMSRKRFANFTDDEVAALHAYLRSLANRQEAPAAAS